MLDYFLAGSLVNTGFCRDESLDDVFFRVQHKKNLSVSIKEMFSHGSSVSLWIDMSIY